MVYHRKLTSDCYSSLLYTVHKQTLHSCRLSKIRVSVGKALKARNVPRLEFRFNQLSVSQAAVMEELDRVKGRDP